MHRIRLAGKDELVGCRSRCVSRRVIRQLPSAKQKTRCSAHGQLENHGQRGGHLADMVHVLRTAETHVLFTVFIDTLGVDHYWTERQKSQGADMRPVWRTVNTSAHRVLEDLAGGLYSPKFFS